MNIDRFINFINELVDDEFDYILGGASAEYYFLHGGCYELYKIVSHYYKDANCVINKNLDHCAILYNNSIYDASGIIENKENYQVASNEDIEYMERHFGLHINALEADSLIKEINDCNLKGIC